MVTRGSDDGEKLPQLSTPNSFTKIPFPENAFQPPSSKQLSEMASRSSIARASKNNVMINQVIRRQEDHDPPVIAQVHMNRIPQMPSAPSANWDHNHPNFQAEYLGENFRRIYTKQALRAERDGASYFDFEDWLHNTKPQAEPAHASNVLLHAEPSSYSLPHGLPMEANHVNNTYSMVPLSQASATGSGAQNMPQLAYGESQHSVYAPSSQQGHCNPHQWNGNVSTMDYLEGPSAAYARGPNPGYPGEEMDF